MSNQKEPTTIAPVKKVYVAGKVTGEPREKVEKKFKWATEQLLQAGYIVYNPVSYIQEDVSWHDAMRVGLRLLTLADEIALLPDWAESKGAQLEFMNAQALNMPVLLLTDIEEEV